MKIKEREIINSNSGELVKIDVKEVNSVNIDLSKLHHNIDVIRGMLKPKTKLMAVEKGDAYGHGLVPVAKELEKASCDAIGVVRLTEALALRNSGINLPILILSPIIPSEASQVVKHNIAVMVDREEIVECLEKTALRVNKTVNVHIKVNTGLNRFGVEPEEILNFINRIYEKYPSIKIQGIYSHFRDAELDPVFTKIQLDRFNKVLALLEKEGVLPEVVHMANSAGTALYPEAHFDMVRCGIILYGIKHKIFSKKLTNETKPILSLIGKIIKVRKITTGETGGYGSEFIAQRDSMVAEVGIGFGDGVSRGWKSVLFGGEKVPVISYYR